MDTKTCTKCFIEKPANAEFFYRAKHTKDGWRPECKDCHNKPKQIVYEFPASKVCTGCGVEHMATAEFFQLSNKGKYGLTAICKKCSAEYYEQNKKMIARRFKRWYRDGGREKVLVSNSQRRARLAGAKGSHTIEQWEDRCGYYGNKCVDCGSSEITKDHRIPLSKGGTNWASNLIPRCKPCNSGKRDRWIG